MEAPLKFIVDRLNELPFKGEVLVNRGEIYAIGGFVRDAFLNKESKDLDIVITKIELDDLKTILEKTGRVDIVGESFGIIKYKAFDSDEEIDIALPRTESPSGERGHKAFVVNANPYISIVHDLSRRDFTMNSIAIDTQGNIIDLYKGIKHINKKKVKITNEDAFLDDPLRMLRAIGMAARFDFKLTKKTLKLIQSNASRINEISPERILIELEKIVSKGNPKIGSKLLLKTGLYEEIFKQTYHHDDTLFKYENVKTLGEFIFLLCHSLFYTSAEFYKTTLKGDINTFKEIKGLTELTVSLIHSSTFMIKKGIYRALNTYPPIVHTSLFKDLSVVNYLIEEFKSGKYPKSLKELDINGHELLNLGYSGPDIGKAQNSILEAILQDKIVNKKEQILEYLKGGL